jgi:hypothetical protein
MSGLSLDGLHRVLRMSVEARRPDAVEVVREELARRGVAADPGPVRAVGQEARPASATRARTVAARKRRAPLLDFRDEDGRLAALFEDLLDALDSLLTGLTDD